VVGVDNRAEICESTSPTLSSVDPGVQTQYAEAMALLAKLMADGTRGQALRRLPARGVVERASTRLLSDGRVDRAREFIRVHACEEGFAVGDVARSMCVCRTLADRLFRKVAGTTILSEIHTVRIERAKELLAAGRKPDLVAAECGYASADDFRRVFRQHTGQTPRKWALARV
jgi:AraC-like DNA-binding protein